MPEPKDSPFASLRYRFDNAMSWSAVARFLLVFASGMTALVVGAVLLRVLAPSVDAAGSLSEALWWSWGRVADPGSGAGDTGTGQRVAEVLTTLSGLFVFALLIGFVSSGVEERLGDLRKGRSRVVERGHVVLLGFGEKTLTIISELAEAWKPHADGCVVILSMQEKAAVIDAVLARFGGPKVHSTRIVVSNGCAWSPADLQMVGVPDARSIVVLAEDGAEGDRDVRVVKTLLAMMRGLGRSISGSVVVELPDPHHRDVVEAIGGEKTEIVMVEQFLARLLVQTVRQTGLAQVYADLLSFRGEELYLTPVPPALVGKTFREAWSTLPMTVVCGVEPKVRKPGQKHAVVLCPPDDTVLGANDKLLVIVADDSVVLTPTPMRFDATLPEATREHDRACERFLVVGYNGDLGEILEELDHYVADGSHVTILTALTEPECRRRLAPWLKKLTRLAVTCIQGDSTSKHDLEDACALGFDAEIVLADAAEVRSADDVDARTLMTLLLLRKLAQSGLRISTRRLISEIKNPSTKELAAAAQVGDFVVSDELSASFLAQVAESRDIADVWADLCDAEGREIFLKPTSRYVRDGEKASFADVMARARARGEVALGYKRGGDQACAVWPFGVVLNPRDKEEPLPALTREDRIIVISEFE